MRECGLFEIWEGPYNIWQAHLIRAGKTPTMRGVTIIISSSSSLLSFFVK
jgi:hypothetical protein